MSVHNELAEQPLDPVTERLRKKLARLLLVSGGIMMLGLIAVFAAIVYKVGEHTPTTGFSAGAPIEAMIGIPAGHRLVATELDGTRALLTLEGPGGSAFLLLVDLESGEKVGRYELRPE